MKIFETEDDGVIGELRYLTVEINQTEFTAGVISQDTVKRYFIEKRPDLKVKKCGGIKINHQDRTIVMRVGVVNQLGVENPVGVDPIVANTSPGYGEQKLLNPGYDELKAKCDKLQNENDTIVGLNEFMGKKFDEIEAKYDMLIRDFDALKNTYDALLMENEELEAKLVTADETYEGLRVAHAKLLKEYGYLDALSAKNVKAARDAAMDVDLGLEGEPELADGPAECNSDDCSDCEKHTCDLDKASE